MKPKMKSPGAVAAANRGEEYRDNGFYLCNHDESSLVGLDRQQSRRAARKDAKWFARNPGRSYRLRRVRPGELPQSRSENWIMVRQLSPGERIRLAIWIKGEGWKVPTSDAELAKLSDAAWNKKPVAIVGDHIVPFASVMQGGNA